jgi:hypothetical protein
MESAGSQLLCHDLAVFPHVDRRAIHPGGLASDLGGGVRVRRFAKVLWLLFFCWLSSWALLQQFRSIAGIVIDRPDMSQWTVKRINCSNCVESVLTRVREECHVRLGELGKHT